MLAKSSSVHDELGGLARDVGPRAAHGHADIGLAQGGRVVDAVARHGHEVPALLQATHDAQLVGGRGARDDGARLQAVAERLVVELCNLGAGQDRRAGVGEADALGDRRRPSPRGRP